MDEMTANFIETVTRGFEQMAKQIKKLETRVHNLEFEISEINEKKQRNTIITAPGAINTTSFLDPADISKYSDIR